MAERRGRERIFEIDPVKRPKGAFLRSLIAKYVGWVQAFGYVFCAAVAAGIVVCWIYTVEEVAREKEAGKSLIKPREEAITHDKDAVVTFLAVKEWQHVSDLANVVEVCDDPSSVARYRMIQHLTEFAKKMRDLEKEGALPPPLAKQVADAEKEVDAWNRGGGRKAVRTMLHAPIEGDVTGTEDIVGKFFKAGETICKVVDFNDLRISIKLSGNNVERVRVGMKAKVRVTPDYGLGCVVRGDAKLGWFDSTRLQFNYALEGKETKSLLLDWWKKHPVVSQEDTKRDVALVPSEIEEAETTCALTTRPLDATEAGKVPESSRIEVDPIAAQNPFRSTVIQGKHTGSYTTNYLSDDMQKELTQRILDALKDKVAQTPGSAKAPVLRIEGVSKVHNFLKIKAAVADLAMEESPKTPKRAGAKPGDKKAPPKEIAAAVVAQKASAGVEWKIMRAGMDERLALAAAAGVDVDKGDRFFEGVVRIANPPPILSLKVKEAYQKTPQAFLKAKVDVVVGECRVAMLLFKQ